jgi:type IV pilus assembly protein PilC
MAEKAWELFRFSLSMKDPNIKLGRRITVLAPNYESAVLATGAHADEMVKRLPVSPIDKYLNRSKKVKKEEYVGFLSALSKGLRSGSTMLSSLRRCIALARSAYFRGVLGSISYSIAQEGGRLSQAMEKHPTAFDDMTIALVQAGEESGRLVEVLQQLAVAATNNLKITRKIKGMMIYPAILGTAMVAAMGTIQFFVIPKMTPMFGAMLKGDLPFSTRTVLGMGNFLTAYPWVLAIPVVAGFIFVAQKKKIAAMPSVNRAVLKIPVIGNLTRGFIMLRALRSLALLLKSAVSLDRTFTITSRVATNLVFRDYFNAIHHRCREGHPLDEAFFRERHRVGEIGLEVAEQIAIARSTGNPAEVLSELADLLQSELDAKLDTLPNLLNVAMLGFFAPLFILVALAIIEPSIQMAVDTLQSR